MQPSRYVLGSSEQETDRLRHQGDVYAAATEHLLRCAGIRPGMRVLDVGAGAGDVSLLLADMVGPSGAVLAIDTDRAVLDTLDRRATDSGLDCVTTRVVSADAIADDHQLAESFDAVVGRLVLLHLPDPAASVARLRRLVRPGGVITFQDIAASRSRSVPPLSVWDDAARWCIDTLNAVGVDPDTGDLLASVFRRAGVPDVDAAAAQPAGLGPGSPVVDLMVGYVEMCLPLLSDDSDRLRAPCRGDLDALRARFADAITAHDAVVYPPLLVGVWSTVPVSDDGHDAAAGGSPSPTTRAPAARARPLDDPPEAGSEMTRRRR